MYRTAIRVGCLAAFLVSAPFFLPLVVDSLADGLSRGHAGDIWPALWLLVFWLQFLLPALLTYLPWGVPDPTQRPALPRTKGIGTPAVALKVPCA